MFLYHCDYKSPSPFANIISTIKVLETTKAIRQSIKNFKERLLRLSQQHFESGRRSCMINIEDKDIDDDCLNEIDEQSRVLMSSLGADYGSFAVEKQEAHEILQVYVL